jgi:monoamine oxidase
MIAPYFGGQLARDLEQAGPASMADFAMAELAGLFGSAIKTRLSLLETTAWASDPFARGSYSYALPGHAGARAVLAEPVDDRLFFAGEACSAESFTTAHGAYLSGLAAADQAIAALRKIRQ